MKTIQKLIIMLFITTLLISCGRQVVSFKEGAIITDIETYAEGCIYYSKTTIKQDFKDSYGYFYDNCGKFNVGDTIKLTK